MLEKYQLPNGMKVILYPSTKSPVVTVQTWVKTGSADERKGEEGISHFIEHLVFKGTRKFKVGQIASMIEGSGGELNAYTSFDQTVFHVTISKEYIGAAMDALTEMMGHPAFDTAEIDNEREVVIEEIKRSNDSPHREASRLLFSGVYKKHPYGKPVIGYEQNIRDFSRDMILNYFHSRYAPSNITLVVVGDFDKTAIKEPIAETFGNIKRFKLRKQSRPKEPSQKTFQTNIESGKFQETLTHLAFRSPSAKHKDTPALDVLAVILGQGDSSRLAQRVRIAKPVVNYVGSHVYSPEDEGFFGISAGHTLNELGEYLTELGEEILRIQLEGVTEGELRKALTILESDEIYGMETVDGLARKLGMFEQLFGKPDYYEQYLKKMLAVTPQDILRVAREYLVPSRLTAAILVSGKKEEAQTVINKWLHDFALAHDALRKVKPEAKKVKKHTPRLFAHKAIDRHGSVEKYALKSGSNLIAAPNYQTPTVSVRLAFRGGQRLESTTQAGLSEFISTVWLAGTQKRTEQDLLEKLDAMASSIRPFSGRNTAGLTLTCLSENLEPSLDLFCEVLRQPLFASDAIDRERVILLENIKQKHDNPAQVAIQTFQELMFAGHPYALDPMGTKETIEKIKHEHIAGIWKTMAVAGNATVVAAGDFDRAKIVKRLETELGGLKPGSAIKDQFKVEAITEEKKKFQKLEKEQSHIIMGYRGLTITDSERHTLQIIQSILAGQGGRLFLELRDKASLAYSVAPLHTEGIETGYFGAYIGCSPDKGTKALEMMEIEFRRLMDQKVPDTEIERAKRYLIGRHDIGLQRNSSIAAAILFEEVYGLPYENVFQYANQVREVTAEDVMTLARKIFGQKAVKVAVGPICPW